LGSDLLRRRVLDSDTEKVEAGPTVDNSSQPRAGVAVLASVDAPSWNVRTVPWIIIRRVDLWR
jgi:hypothetical protein